MKMIIDTAGSKEPKTMEWLRSKWWYRLFNVSLWVLTIFAIIITLLVVIAGSADECKAQGLDKLTKSDLGTDIELRESMEDPPYSLTEDGSLANTNKISGLEMTNEEIEDIARSLGGRVISEPKTSYSCVFNFILGGVVAIGIILLLRTGIHALFVYIAIGNNQ